VEAVVEPVETTTREKANEDGGFDRLSHQKRSLRLLSLPEWLRGVFQDLLKYKLKSCWFREVQSPK